ncbi:MAG: hypothetical protein JW754_02640 [Candidatus Aenigmarchaeota archaeon]|nr:hypothetical protein [Candidatus Aenigmarchaeota archaeon]
MAENERTSAKYFIGGMPYIFAAVLMAGVTTNLSEFYDQKSEIIGKAINGVPLSVETDQKLYKMIGEQNLY